MPPSHADIVAHFFAHGMCAAATARAFPGISAHTVRKWVRRHATPEQLQLLAEHLKPRYSDDLKARVVDHIRRHGIADAVRRYRLPISTIAGWAKKADATPLPPAVGMHPGASAPSSNPSTTRERIAEQFNKVATGASPWDSDLPSPSDRSAVQLPSQPSDIDDIDDYTYHFIITVLTHHLTTAAGDDALTCRTFGLSPDTLAFLRRQYGFPATVPELLEADHAQRALDSERRRGRYSERFRIRLFEYYFSPHCGQRPATAARYFGICTATVTAWLRKYRNPHTIEELRLAVQQAAQAAADADTRRAADRPDAYPIDFIVGTLKYYYEHGHNRRLVLRRFHITDRLLQSWILRYGDYQALRPYRDRQAAADPNYRTGRGPYTLSDQFIATILAHIRSHRGPKRLTVDDLTARFPISRETAKKILRLSRTQPSEIATPSAPSVNGHTPAVGMLPGASATPSDPSVNGHTPAVGMLPGASDPPSDLPENSDLSVTPSDPPRRKHQHYSTEFIHHVLHYLRTHPGETIRQVAARFGVEYFRIFAWKRRFPSPDI